MNGPFAQLLVAKGLKSGLELAVGILGHVWESVQRLKIVRSQSVQVVNLCSLFVPINHHFRPCQGKQMAKMGALVPLLDHMWPG